MLSIFITSQDEFNSTIEKLKKPTTSDQNSEAKLGSIQIQNFDMTAKHWKELIESIPSHDLPHTLSLTETTIDPNSMYLLVEKLCFQGARQGIINLHIRKTKLDFAASIELANLFLVNKNIMDVVISECELDDPSGSTLLSAMAQAIELKTVDLSRNKLSEMTFMAIREKIADKKGDLSLILFDNDFTEDQVALMKEAVKKHQLQFDILENEEADIAAQKIAKTVTIEYENIQCEDEIRKLRATYFLAQDRMDYQGGILSLALFIFLFKNLPESELPPEEKSTLLNNLKCKLPASIDKVIFKINDFGLANCIANLMQLDGLSGTQDNRYNHEREDLSAEEEFEICYSAALSFKKQENHEILMLTVIEHCTLLLLEHQLFDEDNREAKLLELAARIQLLGRAVAEKADSDETKIQMKLHYRTQFLRVTDDDYAQVLFSSYPYLLKAEEGQLDHSDRYSEIAEGEAYETFLEQQAEITVERDKAAITTDSPNNSLSSLQSTLTDSSRDSDQDSLLNYLKNISPRGSLNGPIEAWTEETKKNSTEEDLNTSTVSVSSVASEDCCRRISILKEIHRQETISDTSPKHSRTEPNKEKTRTTNTRVSTGTTTTIASHRIQPNNRARRKTVVPATNTTFFSPAREKGTKRSRDNRRRTMLPSGSKPAWR